MSRQTRREFLKSVSFSASLAIAPRFAFGEQTAKKPNIIFILTDDLGYGDLGCYGQEQIKTPNLDRMAAEGMRFTNHYAGSTVCAPSRCVLMTGRHTGHCYVRGNKGFGEGDLPLPEGTETVATALKGAGYSTGLVGKWGLGGPGTSGIPNKQGFDYFFGYLSQVRAHNYYPTYLWRNEEKVPLKNEVVFSPDGYAKGLGSAAKKRVEYSHDLFAEDALKFIERNKDKPFFLYLALTIPHANNEAHLVNRHGMEVPDYGIYKDKPWPEAQKGHAAMISRMDADVGRLLAKLKELGIAKNTFVLFSSDNGTHKEGGAKPDFFKSSGPLRGIKRDLYEGGIRVPTIAYWPGTIKAGSVSDYIGGFQDFLPTCTELAKAKTPDAIDGISMASTLLGDEARQKKHKFLYWEFHEGEKKQAVRMGDWKLLRFVRSGKVELYNLRDDLGETRDITKNHSEIVARLEKYLDEARTPSQTFPMPELERLRGKLKP
ncbi:N-acetylgalactosamine-6-O-sulfatase [subsurface metagenome]